jgi:hypothetical protein
VLSDLSDTVSGTQKRLRDRRDNYTSDHTRDRDCTCVFRARAYVLQSVCVSMIDTQREEFFREIDRERQRGRERVYTHTERDIKKAKMRADATQRQEFQKQREPKNTV